MAGESAIYVSAALNRMTEKFGGGLQVCTVLELNDRGVLFVEDGNHGENRPRQNEFAKEGIAFLRPPDLKDGRVDFESCGRITDAGFRRVRKGIGQRGDIILTHRATVGRLAITGDDAPSVFVTNPGTTIWRSTAPDILDQQYLYCFMRSDAFMQQLMSQVGNTSTFDYVSLTQQRGLHVAFPPLHEQQQIANILRTLDNKIELNRRMNATLEGISRAIFKSWFVDFDPVRQKAAGQQPVGMDAQTAAMFPDSFEDSEIGEVPKGWAIAEVRDFLSLSRESVDPSEHPTETFDHYSIPAFDSGYWPSPDVGANIKSQKLFVAPSSVLISKLNPRTPRVWIPQARHARRPVASTEFLVAVPNEKTRVGVPFVFCFASSDSVVEYLASHASGTSNSHQRVRPDDFLSLRTPLASNAVLEAFEKVVKPILQRSNQGRSESRTLAALRDTLLPKLLSGEVRVPEAEEMVGEAIG